MVALHNQRMKTPATTHQVVAVRTTVSSWDAQFVPSILSSGEKVIHLHLQTFFVDDLHV